MAYEYRYSTYSFQDQPRQRDSQAAIDAMSADGWRVHTAMTRRVEVDILWERVTDGSEAAELPKKARKQAVPAPVPDPAV